MGLSLFLFFCCRVNLSSTQQDNYMIESRVVMSLGASRKYGLIPRLMIQLRKPAHAPSFSINSMRGITPPYDEW